jgi:putative spermidine/putrescine transport system ATP-binding protein
MAEPDQPAGPGECTVTGHVGEVVYLGATTRYVIDLDVGGQLVVTQQNLAMSSMEALRVRGKAVRLIWDQQLNRSVEGSTSEGGPEPSGPGGGGK